MEKQMIKWTATGYRPGEKGPMWGPTVRVGTKCEAVVVVEGNREPKTAIVRNGHDYIYQMKK